MEKEPKLRALYLCKILYELTDEDHPLSTVELINLMKARYGLDVYRTTISSDIELLCKFGIDVNTIKTTQNKYYVGSRKFELPEVKLLIDAVESSKFITEKKSEVLVAKLTSLASEHQAKQLKRNLCNANRIKPDNEMIYYIVDAINEAINLGKKISFFYYEYNVKKEKKLKNGGKPYVFSPYSLIWNGDFYYVVGYSDKHKDVCVFRVDRILKAPIILKDEMVQKPYDFNISDYAKTVFQMYGSEACEVTLRCENNLMKYIIERFGEGVQTAAYDMTSFRAIVNVELSPTFYSWVFTFGGKVQIISPVKAKQEYAEMLKQSINALDEC